MQEGHVCRVAHLYLKTMTLIVSTHVYDFVLLIPRCAERRG